MKAITTGGLEIQILKEQINTDQQAKQLDLANRLYIKLS